jgi:iron complex transport system permease protein
VVHAGGRELTTASAARALLGGGDPVERVVVWRWRAPRVALAALVGASLAQAGALLQLLLRNPLADPFVLGVSSGAALASVLAIAAGIAAGALAQAGWGAVGAMVAAILVHGLARDAAGRLAPERIVLAGVVASYLFSAAVMWVVSLAPAHAGQRYLFWLMGSLSGAVVGHVAVVAAVLALLAPVALRVAAALNLVAISEEHAADAGVAVERVKRTGLGVAAVLTGASVAAAGSIGFVGLIVPHAVRWLGARDARLAVPLSALAGAAFLLVADFVSRAAGEVPLGVVTASVGGPFFLLLLARSRTE